MGLKPNIESNILVQRVISLGHINARAYDTNGFIKLIQSTDVYLLRLKDRLEAARAENSLSMPHCPYMIERLENDNHGMSIYQAPFDQHISNLSLSAIETIRTHNSESSSILLNGINDATAQQVHGKTVYLVEHQIDFDGYVTKHTLLKPIVCPKCLCNVVTEAVEDHMKSIACMETMRMQLISKQNIYNVSIAEETQIIRAKNIPFEFLPIGYAMFVPDWVDKVIKTFNAMQSRGMFLDMSLADYLTSMGTKDD